MRWDAPGLPPLGAGVGRKDSLENQCALRGVNPRVMQKATRGPTPSL